MAFERRIESTGRVAAVESPGRPLAGLRIVGAEPNSAICAAGRFVHAVARVHKTCHKQARTHGTIEFHPHMAPGKTLLQPAMMSLPLTGERIEIVQTAQVGILRGFGISLGRL